MSLCPWLAAGLDACDPGGLLMCECTRPRKHEGAHRCSCGREWGLWRS